MKINVLRLDNELVKLNQVIDKYENELFINLYNEFNGLSYVWNDGHTKSFFENIKNNKVRVEVFIDEIRSVIDIYEYLINKYSDIGDKIFLVTKNKDFLMIKFNKYIDKIDELINCYDNLDLSFCYEERKILLEHKNKLIGMKDNTLEVKSKVKNIFNTIEEIELVVKQKLFNLSVGAIKELKFGNNFSDKGVMDVDVVEKIIGKLKVYWNEEFLVKNELYEVFNKMINNYDTGNSEEFENIVIEINNKFKKVIDMHNYIIKNVNDNCSLYKETTKKVNNIFDNIA